MAIWIADRAPGVPNGPGPGLTLLGQGFRAALGSGQCDQLLRNSTRETRLARKDSSIPKIVVFTEPGQFHTCNYPQI